MVARTARGSRSPHGFPARRTTRRTNASAPRGGSAGSGTSSTTRAGRSTGPTTSTSSRPTAQATPCQLTPVDFEDVAAGVVPGQRADRVRLRPARRLGHRPRAGHLRGPGESAASRTMLTGTDGSPRFLVVGRRVADRLRVHTPACATNPRHAQVAVVEPRIRGAAAADGNAGPKLVALPGDAGAPLGRRRPIPSRRESGRNPRLRRQSRAMCGHARQEARHALEQQRERNQDQHRAQGASNADNVRRRGGARQSALTSSSTIETATSGEATASASSTECSTEPSPATGPLRHADGARTRPPLAPPPPPPGNQRDEQREQRAQRRSSSSTTGRPWVSRAPRMLSVKSAGHARGPQYA